MVGPRRTRTATQRRVPESAERPRSEPHRQLANSANPLGRFEKGTFLVGPRLPRNPSFASGNSFGHTREGQRSGGSPRSGFFSGRKSDAFDADHRGLDPKSRNQFGAKPRRYSQPFGTLPHAPGVGAGFGGGR